MHGVCVVEDDVLMTCALHRAYLDLKKYEDAVESLQKVDTALSNLAVLVVGECLYLSVLHLHQLHRHWTWSRRVKGSRPTCSCPFFRTWRR